MTKENNLIASNIFLGSNGDVKLADLGIAGRFSDHNTFVGRSYWRAPEVVRQDGMEISSFLALSLPPEVNNTLLQDMTQRLMYPTHIHPYILGKQSFYLSAHQR
jgi:serine/threonine protein kinase